MKPLVKQLYLKNLKNIKDRSSHSKSREKAPIQNIPLRDILRNRCHLMSSDSENLRQVFSQLKGRQSRHQLIEFDDDSLPSMKSGSSHNSSTRKISASPSQLLKRNYSLGNRCTLILASPERPFSTKPSKMQLIQIGMQSPSAGICANSESGKNYKKKNQALGK